MSKSGEYIFHTNAVIALMQNDSGLVPRFAEENTYISSITIGELYSGAMKSHRIAEDLKKVQVLISESKILPCDELTAAVYGDVKISLRISGRPIPDNDA